MGRENPSGPPDGSMEPTDEEKKFDEIKRFEYEHNVNQDTIAQSYLAHCDIYKQLWADFVAARKKYDLLAKSNSADHPSVIEAKNEWDAADAKAEKERNIMLPMVHYLTKETLIRYKKDFELHGAINPDYKEEDAQDASIES